MLLIRSSPGLRLGFALILALVLLASGAAAPAAGQTTGQETEQEGESGDTDQGVDVSQSGDNSNQCVGVQPVSNTGNAQTAVDIIIETPAGHQYTKRFDIEKLVDELDLDLEDIGSSIEIDPELTVECAQEVNQAATASDTSDAGSCSWVWDNGYWCLWSTDGSWWYQDSYGSWTAYATGLWYPDYGGWWWLGYDGWWWTDGYSWTPYGWDSYTTVGNVAAGTLDAAKGTMPLVTLGALALIGTAGILIRRNRRHDPEG